MRWASIPWQTTPFWLPSPILILSSISKHIESQDQERDSFLCRIDSCYFHPEPIFHENNHRLSVMIFHCWIGFVTRNQNERLIVDQKGRKDQRQWEKRLHTQVLSWLWEESKEVGVFGFWWAVDVMIHKRWNNKCFSFII